jgi:hypothetical protein
MRFTAYILMLLTIAVYGCKKDILDLDLTDHQQERIIGEGMITQHFKKQRFFFSLSSNLGDVNQTVTNEANLLIKTPAGIMYYTPIGGGWYESEIEFQGQAGFNYTIQFTYEGEFHEVVTEMPEEADIKSLILPDTGSFSYPHFANSITIEMSSEANQMVHFDIYHVNQEWQEITLPVYQQFSLYPDTSQIITVPFDNATSPAIHIGDTLVVVSKTLSNDVSDYLQGLQSYVTSEVLNSQYYNPPFYYSNGAYGLGYGTFIDTIYHVVGQ